MQRKLFYCKPELTLKHNQLKTSFSCFVCRNRTLVIKVILSLGPLKGKDGRNTSETSIHDHQIHFTLIYCIPELTLILHVSLDRLKNEICNSVTISCHGTKDKIYR